MAAASSWSVSDSTNQEPASGSGVSVTPASWAMICCVRSARRADSTVGRASASSRELVCRLWVPPRTAASACSVVLTTLLSIDCAVSEEPAVWVWKRHIIERAFDAPNRSFMIRAHIRRAARNLATSSNSSDQAAKKKDSRGAKSSTARPRPTAASTYAMPSARVKASSWAAVAPASRM